MIKKMQLYFRDLSNFSPASSPHHQNCLPAPAGRSRCQPAKGRQAVRGNGAGAAAAGNCPPSHDREGRQLERPVQSFAAQAQRKVRRWISVIFEKKNMLILWIFQFLKSKVCFRRGPGLSGSTRIGQAIERPKRFGRFGERFSVSMNVKCESLA